MATGIFEGAAAGVLVAELVNLAKRAYPYLIIATSASARNKFKEKLNALKTAVDKYIDDSSNKEALVPGIHDFQSKLDKGLQLVEEFKTTRILQICKKIRCTTKIRKLGNDIAVFIPQISFTVVLSNANHLSTLGKAIQHFSYRIDANLQQPDSRFRVPNRPSTVGFDESVRTLKERLLDGHENVVGVTGMSGMGKSTLALALCHDDQIKAHFGSRVIYITVSKDPNLKDVLETMWVEIVRDGKQIVRDGKHFRNIEEAHNQLQSHISSRPNQATLVVLDDVWPMSEAELEKLFFQGKKYKTLVTTRDESTIPIQSRWIYKMPSLQKEHALTLFCDWAFGQETIPSGYDEELVKQVQAKCGNLPLALKVIGSSLRDKPLLFWENVKKKLSEGKVMSKSHEGLLKHLKTSIDVLENNEKQCFFDLAVFPQGRIISANALLDIWVNVRGMDLGEAFQVLWEFAARNLLDLKLEPWSHSGMSYGCVYGFSFSQHDLMRDLAVYLGEQDKNNHYRRLFISSTNWQADIDKAQRSKAEIVYMHIGGMDDAQWPQTEFPEARVLVLFFTASDCCLPACLDTMKKLEVLIIHNFSARRAELNGLDGFKALCQLKTLRLEGLKVPPLNNYCKFMGRLEKISLSLCEDLGNMNELGRDEFFNFPRLSEINVDHCSDLEELPTGICSLSSLKKVSVTNCHRLAKLPDELGNLGFLEVLRLCASPCLKALPPSICSLGQLRSLDISVCMGLNVNKRECSELKIILQNLSKLISLKYVICDKNNEQLFKEANSRLNVEAVEEQFVLDWLSY